MGTSRGYRRAPVKKSAKHADGEEQVSQAPSPAFHAHDAERDSSQLDPQAALRLQQSAGNTALTNVIQRKKGPAKRTMAPDVGAVEAGFDVGGVAPGKAGYSSRMMVEAGEMAGELQAGGGLDNLLLSQVAPDVSGVTGQEKVMAKAKQLWLDQKGFFDTPSTTKVYQGWADGAQGWLDGVAEDRNTLQQHGTAFNAFVPRGNAFFTSAARLSSMQSLLGATDNASLVAAISEGLADAQAVAQKYRDAVEGSDSKGGPETLKVPASDETVERAAGDVTTSVKTLNQTYIGFRQAMNLQEIEKIEAEGADDKKRLAEIEEVKKFVKQVGGAIDSSMAFVSAAPAAVTNITNTMRKTEAQVNAMRNRKQILKGGRPTHNPTYLTTNEKGDMVVANAYTGMQKGADGEATAIPESGLKLPTSVENIMGDITEFVYAKEVKEIQMRLQAISDRVSSVKKWNEKAEVQAKILAFQNALAEFARQCNELQERIAARRNAYLDFGVQLDRFARANKELKSQGLGTGKGAERYTTIMTVAGQIREVLSLGRNAGGGGMPTRAELGTWWRAAHERREASAAYSHRKDPMASPPFWVVPSFPLTPGEVTAIKSMYEQSGRFEATIKAVTEMLGPVDAAASGLFTDARVSPGGGSGRY